MYIGHVGVALAARRVRTSIGLLVLLIATFTPDWVDAGLCLAGGYDPREMLSHSIPAVLVFALVAVTPVGVIVLVGGEFGGDRLGDDLLRRDRLLA